MQRRDFLYGTLTGVAAGAGVAELSHRVRAQEKAEPEPTPAPDGASPAPKDGTGMPDELPLPELGAQPPDGRQLSFAQQGEDLMLRHTLLELGIERPRYLDIGAFHPTISSNSYLLYVAGGHGVLVEPNPMMAQMLSRYRPKDTVVNAGIGIDERTEADYYLIRDRPQLNTFSREQVDRYVAQGGPGMLERTIKMKLQPIGEVLDAHFDSAPDLISIDVEGLDLQILQTLDFDRYRPAVFCVETVVFGTTGIVAEVVDYLKARRYAVRGGTMINTIFVDEERLRAKAPADARITF